MKKSYSLFIIFIFSVPSPSLVSPLTCFKNISLPQLNFLKTSFLSLKTMKTDCWKAIRCPLKTMTESFTIFQNMMTDDVNNLATWLMMKIQKNTYITWPSWRLHLFSPFIANLNFKFVRHKNDKVSNYLHLFTNHGSLFFYRGKRILG